MCQTHFEQAEKNEYKTQVGNMYPTQVGPFGYKRGMGIIFIT